MWKKIWQFLQVGKNQGMLTLLAIVIAGIWAVFVWFFPAPEHKPLQKSDEASCGSVVIGGDASGATITAGNSGDCPKPRP